MSPVAWGPENAKPNLNGKIYVVPSHCGDENDLTCSFTVQPRLRISSWVDILVVGWYKDGRKGKKQGKVIMDKSRYFLCQLDQGHQTCNFIIQKRIPFVFQIRVFLLIGASRLSLQQSEGLGSNGTFWSNRLGCSVSVSSSRQEEALCFLNLGTSHWCLR